jgi:hypothetical protein
MEIKVRGLDVVAVNKIDELAKREGVSRNEYLKRTIESFSLLTTQNSIIDRLEKQIETNNILMEQTTKTLDDLVFVLKELIVDE